jgi:hypothetical protein
MIVTRIRLTMHARKLRDSIALTLLYSAPRSLKRRPVPLQNLQMNNQRVSARRGSRMSQAHAAFGVRVTREIVVTDVRRVNLGNTLVNHFESS